MGFFNVLETFFFISLAITFVLIIMLVYHFKGRLTVLEQKCDTMFEIMNNMVKEMKNIRGEVMSNTSNSYVSNRPPVLDRMSQMPPELMQILQMGPMSQGFANAEEYEEDDDDEEEEEEEGEDGFKKIVVSDTEMDSDDEGEDVKVINIEIGENQIETASLPDLEEVDDSSVDLDDEVDDIVVNKLDSTMETDESGNKSEPVDYKKLDVSYLRTLVISRGLASDTKKMKKPELVKLLEQTEE
jgi:hypothetical protein